MIRFILTALTLSCCMLTVHAQHLYSISGTIIDKNNEALPGAAVYLSGYKLVTVADTQGKFTLKGLQAGNYELLVQMIGFLPSTKNVVIADTSQQVTITLVENVKQLNEVVIRPDARRDFYLKLFKESFIGTSAFAKQCKIINPEVIMTDFDTDKKILKITCTDFLVIENKALGYRIKYLLKGFECDETGTKASYYGYPSFEELKGSSQNKRYIKNRSTAYKGSPQHFFNSLYTNKTREEGFVINKLEKIKNPDRLPDLVIDRKIASLSTPTGDVVRGKISKRKDSLNKWEDMYNLPKFITVHNMNDVLVDTLVKSDAKDFKSINFNDILFLVYTKESETLTYTEQSSHFITRPKVYTDNQVSLIKQLKGPIKFYQSGAVFNPMAVLYGGFWSYERIGDLMPMDYNPRSGK